MGRVASLPFGNIGKLSSDKAVAKSIANGFTEEEHYAVAAQVINLYRHSKLREIQPDIKHSDIKTQIPRYAIKISLGGQKAQALITLKETLQGIYKGNRLYSIELEEIAKL